MTALLDAVLGWLAYLILGHDEAPEWPDASGWCD